MKRIIDGKKYDTETAVLVAEHRERSRDGYPLYRLLKKSNNELFVHHIFSPIYEEILTFTDKEMRKYVEDRHNDLYETIFGPVEE